MSQRSIQINIQHLVLSQNLDTTENCITPVNLNDNSQMDLTWTFNDTEDTFDASQSINNHDKNNETNWWHIACKIDCRLKLKI